MSNVFAYIYRFYFYFARNCEAGLRVNSTYDRKEKYLIYPIIRAPLHVDSESGAFAFQGAKKH